MPVYKLTPADRDMPADEAAMIARDFDSAIKILNEDGPLVEVEMTEEQLGDFLATYEDWKAEKFVYADINKPATNFTNLQRAIAKNKPQPQ